MRKEQERPPAPTAAGETADSVSETGSRAFTSTPAEPEGEGARAGDSRTISKAYSPYERRQSVGWWSHGGRHAPQTARRAAGGQEPNSDASAIPNDSHHSPLNRAQNAALEAA